MGAGWIEFFVGLGLGIVAHMIAFAYYTGTMVQRLSNQQKEISSLKREVERLQDRLESQRQERDK